MEIAVASGQGSAAADTSAKNARGLRLGEWMMEAGWLLCAALTPPAIAPWGASIFDLPKAAVVWASAALVAAGWLAASPSAPPASAARRAAAALTAIVLLSAAFSLSPLQSVMGSHQRVLGAATWLACLTVFAAVSGRLRTDPQAGRLLGAVALGSLPVALYAVVQISGLDPLLWHTAGLGPGSTLGRNNFLGAYLVMAVPLTVACLLRSRRRPVRAAWLALILVQAGCLAATINRAAVLGAGAVALVLAAAALLQAGRPRAAQLAATAVPVMTLAGVAAVAWLPGLEGSLGARALIWRSTLGLIAARPILGLGPDNFGQAFTAVYPAGLVYLQGRAVIVDRAHNLLLDTAASLGLVGLAIFLAAMALCLALGLRNMHRASPHTAFVVACAVAAVVGHLVETQFSFAVVTTLALLWICLGLLVSPWAARQAATDEPPAPHRQARLWRGLAGAVVLVLSLTAIGRLLIADASAGESMWVDSADSLPADLSAAQRAVDLWPWQPAYHERTAWLQFRLAKVSVDPAQHLAAAESSLQAALSLAPGDYRLWAGLGEVYTEWANAGDTSRSATAESSFRRAIDLFPANGMTHTALGLAYRSQGRLTEAAAEFQAAIALDNTDAWAYTYLGDAELAGVRPAQARDAYLSALRWQPGLSAAHIGLVHAYRALGLPDQACAAAAAGSALAPMNADLAELAAACRQP